MKIEGADHLRQLLQRSIGPNRKCADRSQLSEQVAITREQHAALESRACDELPVECVNRKLHRVHIDDAEPAGKPTEHRIGEKAGSAHARLESESPLWGDPMMTTYCDADDSHRFDFPNARCMPNGICDEEFSALS